MGRAGIVPIGLAAGSMLFAAIIMVEVSDWQAGTGDNRIDLAATARPRPGAAPLPPDRHADWLRQIRARPLFSPERRPIETGVTGLPRLAGIVVNGTQRVAIFAGPSNGHPVLAQAGGHVGAFDVRSITSEGVTVFGPDGTATLRPAFDMTRLPLAQASSPPTPRTSSKK